MSEHNDTISTINDLIETCKDGEYGFRACGEQAKAESLKALFGDRAAECAAAAAQLQAHVRELGGSPDQGGSTLGAVHRGWVALKSSLTSYSDLAVLEECERGEDKALESYRDALAEPLPAQIRVLVEQQLAGVKKNHDRILALRDTLKKAV